MKMVSTSFDQRNGLYPLIRVAARADFAGLTIADTAVEEDTIMEDSFIEDLDMERLSLVKTVEEEPRVKPSLMTLPQELRDKIYCFLLTKTYSVPFADTVKKEADLHPSDTEVSATTEENAWWDEAMLDNHIWSPDVFNHVITHPKLLPPKRRILTDTVVPWERPSIDKESLQQQNKKWLKLREKLLQERSLEGLAILRTSKKLYREASPMLFPRCTFHFHIAHPIKGETILHQVIFRRVQNLSIHLDLIKSYLFDRSRTAEPSASIRLAVLLHAFTLDNIKRKSCVLQISYREDAQFLLQLAKNISRLTKFETLVLKMAHVYKHPAYRDIEPAADGDEEMAREETVEEMEAGILKVYQELNRGLERKFGAVTYRDDGPDFYWLVYHPWCHVNGGERPRFRVKNFE